MNKLSFLIRLVLIPGLTLFLLNLGLKLLTLVLAIYLAIIFVFYCFLTRLFSEDFIFWFIKFLDLILVFILLFFTGGRESPLFFLVFMPVLETALTKSTKKTDIVAVISLLLMSYFFLEEGFALEYEDWLFFFVYIGTLGLISFLALKLSKLREEITQKEEIQRYLLSSLSAGLLFLDSELKVLSWNPRAVEILGKIVRGQSLREILGQDLGSQVSRGEVKRGDRTLGYSVFPLRRGKETLGWGFLFQDITELKEREKRLREAEKLASLGTMAAGLIHEIKNPLATISGGVEFLKENLGSSGELGPVLEVISRETERLNRLVTNFLFFARPERGEKEKFNLKDLLREILETNQALFSQVKIKSRIPDLEIEANKEQWRQIMENLLINAVEASIEAQKFEVEVEVEVRDTHYLVKVKDYGPGIREDLRSRIFEPFFTTKPQGTGLGLAVVYRIVENLKGEVKLLSQEGEGTRFEIKLPR